MLCCSTNDNLSEESPVPYAKFSVELQVVSSIMVNGVGFNPEQQNLGIKKKW